MGTGAALRSCKKVEFKGDGIYQSTNNQVNEGIESENGC